MIRLGTDVVDLDRFRRVLDRTPGVLTRVFTADERREAGGQRDPTARLAGRFAVKEATMKALGSGLGSVRFRDVEVVSAPSGEPLLRLTGSAADLAGHRGLGGWAVSISHSDLVALAVVVAWAGDDAATTP